MIKKPLGRKAYGSIPHLPGSKLGPGDHHISEGQARMLLEKPRKGDTIVIQVKLDGSNVAVAKLLDGRIVPLTRSGYVAETSPYLLHHLFSDWVYSKSAIFESLLNLGEWISGEWMAQVHSIVYELHAEPFIPFDIFSGGTRITYSKLRERLQPLGLHVPSLIFQSTAVGCDDTLSMNLVKQELTHRWNGVRPLESHEGAVWRYENKQGQVEFMAKWVRPDFVAGKFLENEFPTWNPGLKRWLPSKAIKRLDAIS
ncbi:MAG: RNA ligase family protein [Cyanobacteria bacterium P01_D01_bin.115]